MILARYVDGIDTHFYTFVQSCFTERLYKNEINKEGLDELIYSA